MKNVDNNKNGTFKNILLIDRKKCQKFLHYVGQIFGRLGKEETWCVVITDLLLVQGAQF